MHQSERNRLEKVKKVLILAAADMDQAIAAARELRNTASDDQAYRRMLETAMALCYMRPYTPSSLLTLPAEYIPTGSVDAGYHGALDNLRDQTYAHTDKRGGRNATMRTTGEHGDIVSLEYREEWLAFPTDAIPALLDFFERQRTRFLTAAASIHVDLKDDV
jgi:hypothetical protein